MKLCKLKNKNEEATQACFDQELLKIESLYPVHKLSNLSITRSNVSYQIDDYTIRVPLVQKWIFKNNKITADDSEWDLKF